VALEVSRSIREGGTIVRVFSPRVIRDAALRDVATLALERGWRDSNRLPGIFALPRLREHR
jgi:hypothetical protein